MVVFWKQFAVFLVVVSGFAQVSLGNPVAVEPSVKIDISHVAIDRVEGAEGMLTGTQRLQINVPIIGRPAGRQRGGLLLGASVGYRRDQLTLGDDATAAPILNDETWESLSLGLNAGFKRPLSERGTLRVSAQGSAATASLGLVAKQYQGLASVSYSVRYSDRLTIGYGIAARFGSNLFGTSRPILPMVSIRYALSEDGRWRFAFLDRATGLVSISYATAPRYGEGWNISLGLRKNRDILIRNSPDSLVTDDEFIAIENEFFGLGLHSERKVSLLGLKAILRLDVETGERGSLIVETHESGEEIFTGEKESAASLRIGLTLRR